MQCFVGIDIVFTVVERIKTAVILRLQLLRIEFGFVVNLRVVRILVSYSTFAASDKLFKSSRCRSL